MFQLVSQRAVLRSAPDLAQCRQLWTLVVALADGTGAF